MPLSLGRRKEEGPENFPGGGGKRPHLSKARLPAQRAFLAPPGLLGVRRVDDGVEHTERDTAGAAFTAACMVVMPSEWGGGGACIGMPSGKCRSSREAPMQRVSWVRGSSCSGGPGTRPLHQVTVWTSYPNRPPSCASKSRWARTLAFLPKMQNLTLLMRKHQTNTNWRQSTEKLTCMLQK